MSRTFTFSLLLSRQSPHLVSLIHGIIGLLLCMDTAEGVTRFWLVNDPPLFLPDYKFFRKWQTLYLKLWVLGLFFPQSIYKGWEVGGRERENFALFNEQLKHRYFDGILLQCYKHIHNIFRFFQRMKKASCWEKRQYK